MGKGSAAGTAGPDAFVSALAAGLDPAVHGEERTHFYTFGGLRATSAWARDFATAAQAQT